MEPVSGRFIIRVPLCHLCFPTFDFPQSRGIFKGGVGGYDPKVTSEDNTSKTMMTLTRLHV